MKQTIILSIFLTFSILSIQSCDSKQKLKDRISHLEEAVSKDRTKGRIELADAYTEFATTYPEDSLSEEYLLSAVNANSGANEHLKAIDCGEKYLMLFKEGEFKNRVILTMAKSYFGAENSDSAIKMFEKVPMGSEFMSTDIHFMKKSFLLFIEQHPDDSRSIDYSIKAANLLAETGSAERAVTVLSDLVAKYPDSEFSPYALMRSADIMEVQLKQIHEADSILRLLIEKYPKSNFARDANVILEKELLGLSDEEKFAKITGSN